jgi:uncharacterized protein (DUF1501 family)
MKRRNFLKTSALIPVSFGSLKMRAMSSSPLLNMVAGRAAQNDRVLVLILLGGGNDGLNTLIPTDQYSNLSKARANVLIPEGKVLSMTGKTGIGLHPSMTGFQDMYNNGLVSAVQAVGYPSPNFSHFRSTDIWMTGSDSNENWNTGWMGRYLDAQYPGFPGGYPSVAMPDPLAIEVGSTVSLAFMGPETSMALAISNPSTFYTLVDGRVDPAPKSHYGKELSYIRQIGIQTNAYATSIKDAAGKANNLSTKYPNGNNLADQLKIVARLIKGGLKTPVYMVNLGGFDTHSAQVDSSDVTKGAHANLLGNLSSAIAAFQDDLKLLGIEDRVAGMTFSEFGRRIQSNFSVGTDHGAAAPLFVFGTGVQKGIIGSNPTIPSTTTVNDNVPMQYDFRQVYASVLKDWFGLTATEVKDAMGGKDFNTLPIFKGSISSLEDYADILSTLKLEDAFPNPAIDRTSIAFYTDGGQVQLELYDALGTRIRTLSSAKYTAGKHTVEVDLTGLRGGNYFYQLSQGNKKITKVLVIQ